MKNFKGSEYKKDLRGEARVWDKVAYDEYKLYPPDYSYYKTTLPYLIYRNVYVKKMLSFIGEGHRVLELGSYNGWFTLEMARLGANIDAHDISRNAIDIARSYYRKQKRIERFSGKISYFKSDLNFSAFPRNTYDIVIIRNVLHHLFNLKYLFKKIKEALKPEGIILVDDGLPAQKIGALFTGILLMLLPTDIPYSQKILRVFKKGKILKRTQDLIDAKGASPFEGASGEESIYLIKQLFYVRSLMTFSAFIGSITAHIQLPYLLKLPLLQLLNLFDLLLIKMRILSGTSYFAVAENK